MYLSLSGRLLDLEGSCYTPIARLYMQDFLFGSPESYTFHCLIKKEAVSTCQIPTRCKTPEKGLSSYRQEFIRGINWTEEQRGT